MEVLFTRELNILDAKIKPDHPPVASTLYSLGFCFLQEGRPGEAEIVFQTKLEIKKVKIETDGVSVARTLRRRVSLSESWRSGRRI